MKTWIRAMGFWLPPLLVSAWLSIPALQPAPQTLRGPLGSTEACLLKLACGQVLAVGDARIGCQFDLLGAPYDCRRRLRELPAGTEAVATYVPLPSLARLAGVAPTAGVLTRLEAGGEALHRRSVSSLVWQGLYGGWLFHAVYWPLVGLVIWRWPNSRLARRATWADVTQANESKAQGSLK
jgi:hypothetical protein